VYLNCVDAEDKYKELQFCSVDSGEEVKSTAVSCVDTASKKGNDLLPVLNLRGATNFIVVYKGWSTVT